MVPKIVYKVELLTFIVDLLNSHSFSLCYLFPRMYETSRTRQILNGTPHLHQRLNWTWRTLPPISWILFFIFSSFFTIWDTMVLSFIPVHDGGPCWHILCSVITRRNCVQVDPFFFLHNVQWIQHFWLHLFIWVKYII